MSTPTHVEGQKVRAHVDATAAIAATAAADRHSSTIEHLTTEIHKSRDDIRTTARTVGAEVRGHVTKVISGLDATFDRKLKELAESRHTPVLTSLVVLMAFVLGAWIGARAF